MRFTDPQTRAQIERALSGLAENRAKERRRLSIGFLGAGTRKATISYVVAAPVWKTAYRLVLPKEGGKARLQGWAVVENLTGGDWKDVELVLVSGNPVALRQPLYTAFFTDRPEVEVTTAARLVPRTDDADEDAGPRAAKRGAVGCRGAAGAGRRGPRRAAVAADGTVATQPRTCVGSSPVAGDGRRDRPGRRRGRGGGSRDPAALSLSRQALARHRAYHDGAVRRSRGDRGAHLAVPA